MSDQDAHHQSVGTADPEALQVSGPESDIHYYFPIHVVLAGDIAEETRKDIEAGIWDALCDALG